MPIIHAYLILLHTSDTCKSGARKLPPTCQKLRYVFITISKPLVRGYVPMYVGTPWMGSVNSSLSKPANLIN